MGQLGNRMHRRQLHLFVDRRRADVQRAAEDEREAKYVVDRLGSRSGRYR